MLWYGFSITKLCSVTLLICLGAVGVNSMATDPEEALELVQVVVHSRHGIRAPYLPGDGLKILDFTKDTEGPVYDTLSKSLDEQFGVPEAYLTKAGYVNIQHMGKYFREYYIESRGFPIDSKATCDSALNTDTVFFYADDSQRDIETAGNFSLTFLPGCTPKMFKDPAYVLNLFNQGDNMTLCGGPTSEEIAGVVGAKGEKDNTTLNGNVVEAYKRLTKEINGILNCCKPVVCSSETPDCDISGQPRAWTKHYWEVFVGPVTTAGYWAEYFELQYINNNSDVMFGRLAPTVPIQEKLTQFGVLRMTSYDVPTSYWAAQNFGSEMMANLIATMESVVTGQKMEGIKTGPGSKFVYFAGHDFNLLFLRRFLNVEWYSRSWGKSQTALGGMLIFELYRGNVTKNYYVKTFYMAPTMDQLRNQVPLTDKEGGEAPWRAAISVPGCDKLACPWKQFKDIIVRRMKPQCIHDPLLRTFAEAAVDNATNGSITRIITGTGVSKPVFITLVTLCVVFGVLAVVFLVSAIVFRFKGRRNAGGKLGVSSSELQPPVSNVQKPTPTA